MINYDEIVMLKGDERHVIAVHFDNFYEDFIRRMMDAGWQWDDIEGGMPEWFDETLGDNIVIMVEVYIGLYRYLNGAVPIAAMLGREPIPRKES